MSKNISFINKYPTYLKTVLQDEVYLNLMNQKLNELYIMTRDKYLAMFSDVDGNSHWSTIQSWNLNDYHVRNHLLTKNTIGVFSGRYLTKFICFDVDSPTLAYSKKLVQLLMFTLIEEFNVPAKYLHISESGKKGYHVELFFSEALSLLLVKKFHSEVLSYINNTSEIYGDIEFRPTFTQGVKVPLSIHRGTGNFCSFVDPETFKVINDPYYLLKIEQMDVVDFKEKVLDTIDFSIYENNNNYFTLENTKAEETETILLETKPYGKSTEDFTAEMETILEVKHLLKNGSRNHASFYLSIYLNNLGKTIDETKSDIKEILDETWESYRHFIGEDTSYVFMMEEVDRITKYVYEKDYTKKKKVIRFTKSEILKILELPTKTLRKLMFSLLMQSKIYAKNNGEFYMAYSVLTAMGNSTSRSRLLSYLLILEGLGYIDIVQRNKTNDSMTYELNKNRDSDFVKISETNIYKVLIEAEVTEEESYLEIDSDAKITLVETVMALVEEKETKEKLSYRQFYSEYKTEYKKVQSLHI